MFGFGAPTAAPLDQRARDAAGAAQADADAIAAAIAHRSSRMRVHLSASRSLGTDQQIEIGTTAVSYATGAFAGQSNASRITIPPGVSKVRVRTGAYIGGNTTGFKYLWAKMFDSSGAILIDNLAFARLLPSGSAVPETLGAQSSVISVSPGQYFVPFVRNSVSGGTLSVAMPETEFNYLEVEVVE